MVKNNCYITESDPILTTIYTKEEADDLFGADMVEEYGAYLPEDLLTRYKKNMQELWAIQKELNTYKR